MAEWMVHAWLTIARFHNNNYPKIDRNGVQHTLGGVSLYIYILNIYIYIYLFGDLLTRIKDTAIHEQPCPSLTENLDLLRGA